MVVQITLQSSFAEAVLNVGLWFMENSFQAVLEAEFVLESLVI